MTTIFLIYLGCFSIGLLFTIISAFTAHIFGGGHDVHVDTAAGGGHIGADGHAEAGFNNQDMPGFSPVSPTTIASFITAFGGFGMVFAKIPLTQSPWVSAPLSVMSGFAVATFVFWVFHKIFSLAQSSSEAHVGSLVGQMATIITPIPESGVGEIAYVQAGTRYTAPARCETSRPVASGQTVKISRIVGSQFYVLPGQ